MATIPELQGPAAMNPFRSAVAERPAGFAENQEKSVFSAMHALVDRLATTGSAATPALHAEYGMQGFGRKHTATRHAGWNSIVPNAGVKIP